MDIFKVSDTARRLLDTKEQVTAWMLADEAKIHVDDAKNVLEALVHHCECYFDIRTGAYRRF